MGLVFWPAAWYLKARPGWTCALAERSVSGAGVEPECNRGSARETLKGLCLDKAGSLFFMSFFFDASRVLKRIQYADFPCLH